MTEKDFPVVKVPQAYYHSECIGINSLTVQQAKKNYIHMIHHWKALNNTFPVVCYTPNSTA